MGRMDLWCLPVPSEIPRFTRSAHVNEPSGEVGAAFVSHGMLGLVRCRSTIIYLDV